MYEMAPVDTKKVDEVGLLNLRRLKMELEL